MRNIYDIISEQKSMVDINIANYKLAYVAEEFEYVQEGIGESLKNIANKIIEFIKTIIRNIKNFVNKVIEHFFKGKDFIKDADERIKEVNANLEKHANVKMSPEQEERFEKNLKAAEDMINEREQKKDKRMEHDKQRIGKYNITFNGKANDLKGLLKIANGKVVTPGFGPMKTKMNLVVKISNGLEQFENDFDDCFQKVKNEETALRIIPAMSNDTFANSIRKVIYGVEECEITSKLTEIAGDKKENVTFDIKSKADDIFDYLQYGKSFCNSLREGEREVESHFNGVISIIKNVLSDNNFSPENVEKIGNKISAMIQKGCNVITNSFSTLCRLTTIAYNNCKAIANKVLDTYAINNGKGRKEREEFRKRNQISTKQSYENLGKYYEDRFDE